MEADKQIGGVVVVRILTVILRVATCYAAFRALADMVRH